MWRPRSLLATRRKRSCSLIVRKFSRDHTACKTRAFENSKNIRSNKNEKGNVYVYGEKKRRGYDFKANNSSLFSHFSCSNKKIQKFYRNIFSWKHLKHLECSVRRSATKCSKNFFNIRVFSWAFAEYKLLSKLLPRKLWGRA